MPDKGYRILLKSDADGGKGETACIHQRWCWCGIRMCGPSRHFDLHLAALQTETVEPTGSYGVLVQSGYYAE